MKNIIFALLILAITGVRAQTWNTNLNDGSGSPKIGTSTNDPLLFHTNNTFRMTLDKNGKLGIGTTAPEAFLHVIGDGIFSGNVKFQNTLNFSDNFRMEYIDATVSNPKMIVTRDWTPGSYKYKAPCNVWYKDQTQFTSTGLPYSVPWIPPTSNTWQDLMQVYESGTQSNVVLSMGLINGDAVISAEPMPTNATAPPKLKLNPGCSNDVFICEGGGYTKMFNGAGVVGDLTVTYGAGIINGNNSQALVVNNGSSQSNTFKVMSNGQTYIKGNVGIGAQPAGNTILNVYDPVSAVGSNIFSVGSFNAANALIVDYRGATTINANVTTPTTPIFKVKNSNFAVFEIASDGTTYARDVVVTLNNFPDYVFSKEYKMMPINEVRTFIEKNQRLPNMPSAGEVEKNGARLGELQRLTVEKVEELYIYVLELEEKISELNKKLEYTQKKD